MNAIEFVKNLNVNETSRTENLANLPANEYFDTLAGKIIMSFLSEKSKSD